ncbi:alpha/beta hydrolase [Rhizocola hellebori]|uniref:Alpha/beta hydrolase n=1 Tax=Rhizocola hellebori TaxID=1392758 RepID=A0A8J3Q9N3_9ACTN|nr:alpha/beta fold hydrolase [Rhizocola hellebori]GIH06495.1 alpha/beta hydrolase [Rhizocola hellebori]
MKTFVASDGVELAYQEFGPAGPQPPVLLHHGFSTDGTANWVRPGIVDALVDRGRHVIVPDARGHGASQKPHDAASYGEDRMAGDVSRLLDLLAVDLVDVVGYSMGGIVALIVAANDSRVRRLVTGGIGASAAETGGVDRGAVPGHELISGLLADDPATITDLQVMAFRAFADASGADRRALAAQATAAHHRPIGLERITIPALVLAGQDDPLATRPEVLAAALSDARWRVLAGDHLTVVRNPDFAEAIVSFVDAG